MKPQDDESYEYFVSKVVVMHCSPGNYDHADGEPTAILTVAHNDAIETMALSLDDARLVATKFLVALATFDDPIAMKILTDYFCTDQDGNFKWPGPAPE